MSFDTDAPAEMVALRASLAACANWTTLVGSGNELSNIHYPEETANGADLPLAVLSFDDLGQSDPIAAGIPGLPNGTAFIVIHSDSSQTTIAQLERAAQRIRHDLSSQETGLPIRSTSSERSGEPTQGDNDNILSVQISIEYGLI